MRKKIIGSRWFKRDQDSKNRFVVRGIQATATRVMFDQITQSKMGVIVTTVELESPRTDGTTGTVFDRIEIELDLWEANKYASQLLAAIDAAMPSRAMGARKIPWE